MDNINKYRKDYSDLRNGILVEISNLVRKQPNWYLQIQDVLGKLVYQELDSKQSEMIHSDGQCHHAYLESLETTRDSLT